MPSPFPGMNPYLESRWESFHASFVVQFAYALNRVLPPELVARAEDRCYVIPQIEETFRQIKPDVSLSKDAFPNAGASVAVAERVTAEGQPTAIVRYTEQEVREHYIEIRRAEDEENIITAIELLSPTNKTERNKGRESYQKKQADFLYSDSNFIEIDLLRGGLHTVFIPKNVLDRYGLWDHVVTVHRAATPEEYSFYLNRLRDPLPTIRIPLQNINDDILFDLQAFFHECFDGGRFGGIPYTVEPMPPLSPEDAAWADTLLREKGLR